MRREWAAVALWGVLSSLVACSSGDDVVQEGGGSSASSPTPTKKPTETPSQDELESPTDEVTEESVPEVDPADLLVQRDEGGSNKWQPDEPSPGDAEVSENWPCTNWTQGQYSDAAGSALAVAAWFDPRTPNVTDSTQVVRVFDTAEEARKWVDNLRTTSARCREWKDGFTKPPGITTRTSLFEVPVRFGEQMVAWRQQADFGVSATASTWHITARHGRVVSTVDTTSLDDVQALAIREVRSYAAQAERRILETLAR